MSRTCMTLSWHRLLIVDTRRARGDAEVQLKNGTSVHCQAVQCHAFILVKLALGTAVCQMYARCMWRNVVAQMYTVVRILYMYVYRYQYYSVRKLIITGKLKLTYSTLQIHVAY